MGAYKFTAAAAFSVALVSLASSAPTAQAQALAACKADAPIRQGNRLKIRVTNGRRAESVVIL